MNKTNFEELIKLSANKRWWLAHTLFVIQFYSICVHKLLRFCGYIPQPDIAYNDSYITYIPRVTNITICNIQTTIWFANCTPMLLTVVILSHNFPTAIHYYFKIKRLWGWIPFISVEWVIKTLRKSFTNSNCHLLAYTY